MKSLTLLSNLELYHFPQDTPVALQAVSEYGTLIFTKDAQNTVAISVGESFKQHFQVDSSVSTLLQQVPLPSIPGNYSVEVNGSGCVYMQVNDFFSHEVPQQIPRVFSRAKLQ